MNPDADRNTKQSIEQILKQRHKAAFDDDHEEVVSFHACAFYWVFFVGAKNNSKHFL